MDHHVSHVDYNRDVEVTPQSAHKGGSSKKSPAMLDASFTATFFGIDPLRSTPGICNQSKHGSNWMILNQIGTLIVFHLDI